MDRDYDLGPSRSNARSSKRVEQTPTNLDVDDSVPEPISIRAMLPVLDSQVRVIERIPTGVKSFDHGIDTRVFGTVKDRQVIVAPVVSASKTG